MNKPTLKSTTKHKVRRWKTPRCDIRGCQRKLEVFGGIGNNGGFCRSHAKKKAMVDLSIEVRSLGHCQFAGMDDVRCGGVLQAAHIFPKGAYPRIKLDRQNLLCICAGHHRYYTERWPDWRAIVIRLIGQAAFDELWSRSGA